MHILLLTDGLFPYVLGGMQKHSSILASKLLEIGVNVTVVHPGGEGYSQNQFKNDFGNKIHEIVVPFLDDSKLPGHYIRASRKYSKHIRNAIPDFSKYNLIYAQGFTATELYELGNRPKIFLNLHGLGMFQEQGNFKYKIAAKFLRNLARENFKKADFVYSFGSKLDSILIQNGCDQSKILLQTNGITSDWISEKPIPLRKCKRFVFIGRYERCKGIVELYNAFSLLKSEDYQVDFIGPFEEKNKIGSANVIYHGVIKDSNKLRDILDSSDCLLCPSLEEGMPTVIAEAMARGCAIIATDVGAVARQFANNGVLLPNSDPKGIAKAMQSLLEMNPDDFHQLRLNSLAHAAANFTWDKIVEQKIQDFQKNL